MRRSSKRIRKIIFDNLDSLVKSAKTIADGWDLKTIPLTELSKMIDVLASADLGKDNPALNDFQKAYNVVLDNIFKACKAKAKTMDSKNIPVDYLRQAVEVVKKAFDKEFK